MHYIALEFKGFSLVRFFLSGFLVFCKCQNLNYVLRVNSVEFPKCSRNLQMLSIIEKFKSWKILLKNSWKIGTPFGMLAPQAE